MQCSVGRLFHCVIFSEKKEMRSELVEVFRRMKLSRWACPMIQELKGPNIYTKLKLDLV